MKLREALFKSDCKPTIMPSTILKSGEETTTPCMLELNETTRTVAITLLDLQGNPFPEEHVKCGPFLLPFEHFLYVKPALPPKPKDPKK